jgi:phage shock protein PspC (stress-responsive transcriptional regulator)
MTPQDPPTIPEPPAPEPPLAPPRRLTRPRDDRMIGGVASGLARHLGLDPALVRIGFVILSFFGGSGLALYALLWLVLPPDGGPNPIGPEGSPARKVVLVGLIVVLAVSFGLTGPGIFVAAPAVLFVAVLVAIGVLVWHAVGGEGNPSLTRAAWLVLAVAGALALGLAAGVAAAFGAGTAMAILVVVTGVGLIAGGFLGGARWLVVPALVMAVPVAVVTAADIDLTGGVGERDYRPTSVADLNPSYRLGVGSLRVDLSDVDLPPGRTELELHVGLGEAILRVPDDACVQLDAHVGVGQVIEFGVGNDGVDVDVDRRPVPAETTTPILAVRANVGAGELDVDRDVLGADGPAAACGR